PARPAASYSSSTTAISTSGFSAPSLHDALPISGQLLHHDDALEIGHGLENAGRCRAAGDRETGLGKPQVELVEEAGRQDGVAQPVRGDEKNAHAGPLQGVWRVIGGLSGLAKVPGLP